jgi:hypothetical protein
MASTSLYVLTIVFVVGCAKGAGGGDDTIDADTIDATADTSIPIDGATGCGNTQTNPQNCGQCGKVCATGATCTAGKCDCGTGKTECNGACIDTQTDAKNCGSCGQACSGGSSTWSCVAGTCTVGCSGTQTACNNVCVDTQTDNQNCGQCGNACGAKTCCGGQCKDTTSDDANCGTCGTVCVGNATCINSSCSACDGPLTGSCSHNACDTGAALSLGCDGISLCVAQVCASKPLCCLTGWTTSCVNEVIGTCGYTCKGC